MAKAKYGDSKAEYAKHLRPVGKRITNKRTRQVARNEYRKAMAPFINI